MPVTLYYCTYISARNLPWLHLLRSGVFPGSTAYSNWRHNINVLIISHDCKQLGCQCAIICSPKKSSTGHKAHWDICEMCYIRTSHYYYYYYYYYIWRCLPDHRLTHFFYLSWSFLITWCRVCIKHHVSTSIRPHLKIWENW
jgi:hypothetical protein